MAWTGNFKDQMEDLAGVLSVEDDTDAMQQWILDGCYDIVDKAVAKNGAEEIWKFVIQSGTITVVDTDVDEIRTIAGVVRDGVIATRGVWGLKSKYADSGSIYEAVDATPIWYLHNDTIVINPAPTVAEPANYYFIPEYALTNWNTGTSSINNYPSEYYYYAMLYASIQVLHRRMLDSTVPTVPTFEVLPVSPDTVSDASLVYSDAIASVINTIDVNSFLSAPTYTAPTTSLSTLESFASFAGTLTNLTISATAPTVIAAPVINAPSIDATTTAVISGNAPTYSKPSTVITAVTPDVPTLSSVGFSESNALSVTATSPTAISLTTIIYTGISDVDASVSDSSTTTINIAGATQPAYNGGAVIGMAATTNVLATKSITDLTITAVTPDSPVLESIIFNAPTIPIDFDISSIAIPSATITAPNITAEGINTLSLPDVTSGVPFYSIDGTSNARIGFGAGLHFADLAGKTVADLNVTAVAPDTPVIDVVTYIPATTITVTGSDDITASGTVTVATITAASSGSDQPNYQAPDVMGGGSLLSEIEAGTLGAPASDIDPQHWFSIVGQYIEDEEDVELANATMQKISTFINAYQMDVQNALNEFNQEVQVYQQLVQQDTQNINATNQAALNDIQREIQENQANQQKDIQENQTNAQNAQSKALQDAQQTVQAIISNNAALIQKYQAELSVYSAEVSTDIQEYTQNFQKELQLWQNTQTQVMQQHSQTVQDSLNVFNAQNIKYQANIQAEILRAQTLAQEYQKEADIAMQAKIQDYTFELQEWSQEVARYQTNVGSEAQAYQQKLAKHSSQSQDSAHTMQSIVQNNQSLINQYQAELQVYQNESSVATQEWQANTSKELQLWEKAQSFALQEQGQRVQDALNLFNEENAEYQAEVQAEIQQAQITNSESQTNLQKDLQIAIRNKDKSQEHQLQESLQDMQAIIADNQGKITQYQAEASHYGTQVNEDIQSYTSQLQADVQIMQGTISNNESLLQKYQAEIGEYQAEVATLMQVIQADIQNELNEFNKENALYQASVQAELTKFQTDAAESQKAGDLTFQADIQDYTLTLQKFQGDLSRYQALVNDEVAEYTQNLQKALQTWTGEQANRLARYQSEQQDSLNEFNELNVTFQADVQKQLAEYQADIQIAIKNGDSATQVDLTNKSQDVQAAIADYSASLQKYQTEISAYGAELAVYQADSASKLQKYQAELQSDGVSYQWLQDQYGRLKMEYERAFSPQQAAQAEA